MNAKVLLVDDEPTVLACVSAALSRFGCSVTTAKSGESALAHLQQARFDLVVTDFRMPGLGGDGLIRTLRERQDDAAILLITGLADELPHWLRAGPDSVPVLTKPFTLPQLRHEAEAALRARHAVLA